MTICIGALNSNSKYLVLATDSMLTNSYLSIEFEHQTRKMTKLSDTCLVLTAGDALAHSEMFIMAQEKISTLSSPSVTTIVETLKECYQKLRQRAVNELYLIPRGFKNIDEFNQAQRILNTDIVYSIKGEFDKYRHGLDLLVGGVGETNAHLYIITDPGTSLCFDAVGFCAIGSGLPHALNSLIQSECFEGNTLQESIMMVYESKLTAEKAPGVGSNQTNISIITDKIVDIPSDKLDKLYEIHELWYNEEDKWLKELNKLLDELGIKTKIKSNGKNKNEK